jgi:hypothetical protein
LGSIPGLTAALGRNADAAVHLCDVNGQGLGDSDRDFRRRYLRRIGIRSFIEYTWHAVKFVTTFDGAPIGQKRGTGRSAGPGCILVTGRRYVFGIVLILIAPWLAKVALFLDRGSTLLWALWAFA